MRKKQKGRGRRAALAAAGLLALALIGAAAAYLLWEEPPAVRAPEASAALPGGESGVSAILGAESGAKSADAPRAQEVYTLLLVGCDSASGNTDTILVGHLDTHRHSLDFVSIPRDTLVNLDWSVRKLNAVYSGTANSGGCAREGLVREIRKLTGFTVDCCAVVDLDVFAEAVDLIGGVEFEVPQDMDYDDPAQALHIHLKAGLQRLNGEQAMGLVRFRAGYLNGDIDRVELQQRFLKEAASQFIRLGSIPHLAELVTLLSERMDTDLSAANIAWLVRQALQCRSEDLHFHIMPHVPATVHGLSYTFVDLEPWLDMLNDCLNPRAEPVTASMLDLVYRDGDGVHATSGVLRGAWYYDS